MDRYAFAPDPERTAWIDLGIRAALADSVGHVLGEAARLGLVTGGDIPAWRAALLATRKCPPPLWACYHELVQAVLRPEAGAVAARAEETLAHPVFACEPGTVVTLTEASLGSVDAARYARIIDSDPGRPLFLQAASAGEMERLRRLVAEARGLLAETDPVLLDEIDALGHQIVLATGAQGGFGGAASVFLWGAVILNPDRVPDRLTLVESLAHETAHALLFGLVQGADLTTNDPAERYASPLRPDPRPIEGIVHATYVLARMIYALDRVGASPRLDEAERALIAGKRARNLENYRAGLDVVQAHARFTPEGAAIFHACERSLPEAIRVG